MAHPRASNWVDDEDDFLDDEPQRAPSQPPPAQQSHPPLSDSSPPSHGGLASILPSDTQQRRINGQRSASPTQPPQPPPQPAVRAQRAQQNTFPSLDDDDDDGGRLPTADAAPVPAPPSVPLSQQFPTLAEDFIAPSRSHAFRQSDFIQHKQNTRPSRTHAMDAAATAAAATVTAATAAAVSSVAAAAAPHSRAHPAPSSVEPLSKRARVDSPSASAAFASDAVDDVWAVGADVDDAMSRFLEDDDAINADDMEQLGSMAGAGTAAQHTSAMETGAIATAANPSATAAAPVVATSTALTLPPRSTALLPPPSRALDSFQRISPLLRGPPPVLRGSSATPPPMAAATAAVAASANAAAPVAPLPPQQHRPPQFGTAIAPPHSSAPMDSDASPSRPRAFTLPAALPPAEPPTQYPHRPLPQPGAFPSESSPSQLSNPSVQAISPPRPSRFAPAPVVSRSAVTPAPKREDAASPVPAAPFSVRRATTPLSSSSSSSRQFGAGYAVHVAGRTSFKAYPGPIGRMRLGRLKSEEGSTGRGLTPLPSHPPLRSASGASSGRAHDLTLDDAESLPLAALVSAKSEDGDESWSLTDDEGSALDDPDFHSNGWLNMLDAQRVSMPTEAQLEAERHATYERKGSNTRSAVADCADGDAWNYNAHFLQSPRVLYRSKIPRLLCLVSSLSSVALGESRAVLKDPFSCLSACFSRDVQVKWAGGVSHRTALCLTDVTLYHAGPHPDQRVLIVTNRNIAGMWTADEPRMTEEQGHTHDAGPLQLTAPHMHPEWREG